MPGGATVQFGLLPLNFLGENDTAAYLDTSIWSYKAYTEALRCRNVTVAFDGRTLPAKYSRVPKKGEFAEPKGAKYLL